MASKPPESPSGSPAKKKRIVALVEIGMESAEGGRGRRPRMARLMEESEEEQEEEQPEYSPPPISSLSSSPSTHALTRTTLASPPSNLVVRAVFIEDTGCFHVVECSSCSGVFQAASARKHACNAKSESFSFPTKINCLPLLLVPFLDSSWLASESSHQLAKPPQGLQFRRCNCGKIFPSQRKFAKHKRANNFCKTSSNTIFPAELVRARVAASSTDKLQYRSYSNQTALINPSSLSASAPALSSTAKVKLSKELALFRRSRSGSPLLMDVNFQPASFFVVVYSCFLCSLNLLLR